MTEKQNMNCIETNGSLCFDNGMVGFYMNLEDGKITLKDTETGKECLSGAYFRMDDFVCMRIADFLDESYPYISVNKKLCQIWRDKYPITGFQWSLQPAICESGEGQELVITCSRSKGPQISLGVTLLSAKKCFYFAMNIDNTTELPIRVREFHPLSGGIVFKDVPCKDNVLTLDGMSGNGNTRLRNSPLIQSSNNLLLTFESEQGRRSFVAGGLTYSDYAKYVCIDHKDCVEQRGRYSPEPEPANGEQASRFDMMAYDPSGRLVEPGESYAPNDRFYLDFMESDPFRALEQYALSVKAEQGIQVNTIQYPIVNGWYVGHTRYGSGIHINTSAGLVEEMEYVQQSGFLKYAPVAVQLEPDKYHGDTEQGWWDDEHWVRHKHLTPPYDTMRKWGAAIRERGGVPFLYFQAGLPSDDYATAFPSHMLNNDISKLHMLHPHHQPFVTFDYTDSGFQAHLKNVWNDLRECGVRGVKFDYPESAWRPEGGFKGKKETTASAYRTVFRLARDGLGLKAVINERNMGESDRPVVDVTAGLVDVQRVWNDASGFDPYMVTKAGLRWYKNKVLFSYDIESKTFFERKSNLDSDSTLVPISPLRRRAILTMTYMVGCGLLLANSFRTLTPDMIFDISRLYPFHLEARMARPIDAFTGVEHPRVYDYMVSPEWHQVAMYNPELDHCRHVSFRLGGDVVQGSLGVSECDEYYLYEFWSDRLAGICQGTASFGEMLQPGEARMYSVRRRLSRPQVLSSNRHLMQGYVDMPRCEWEPVKRVLSGISSVVSEETYSFVAACNGNRFVRAESTQPSCNVTWESISSDLIRVNLHSKLHTQIHWLLTFE